MSEDIEPKPHPLFAAHKAAFIRAGRDAVAAVVIKHGGHGGPGGIHHVPASKVPACLKDLEALAGGKSTHRTASGFEAIRQKAYGDKPKPVVTARSMADLAESAYQKWNSAKKPEAD